MSKNIINKLLENFAFHIFDEKNSVVRWMCAFNTSKSDVLEFAGAIKKAAVI